MVTRRDVIGGLGFVATGTAAALFSADEEPTDSKVVIDLHVNIDDEGLAQDLAAIDERYVGQLATDENLARVEEEVTQAVVDNMEVEAA